MTQFVGLKTVTRNLKEKEIIAVGGKTTLKQGSSFSPYYVDLREKLFENPDLLWLLGGLIAAKILEVATPGKKQRILGVPEAGTSLAIAASLYAKIVFGVDMPIIMLRRSPKSYGAHVGSLIIGEIDPDAEYNLVDDVVTSGESKIKPIQTLAGEGIKTKRIIVVVDRQQGGAKKLEESGYEFHAILRILEMMAQYLEENSITTKQYDTIKEYIKKNQYA